MSDQLPAIDNASAMNQDEMRQRIRALWIALARPFPPAQIRVRPQGGRQLKYITARTVMNRLDEVLGPENWWDSYLPLEHSVVCKLSVRLPDSSVITKEDAGGYAGMQDQGDDDKSGFSDAFKRAAVKFGVGRHLYGDGVPKWPISGQNESNGHGSVESRDQDPGKELATWASLGSGRREWLTKFGDDLGFSQELSLWSKDMCERACEAYRVAHRPKPAPPAVQDQLIENLKRQKSPAKTFDEPKADKDLFSSREPGSNG